MSIGVGAQAEKIADEIIDDLSCLKGLGDEWDGIDDDIQSEIRARWILLARRPSRRPHPRTGRVRFHMKHSINRAQA